MRRHSVLKAAVILLPMILICLSVAQAQPDTTAQVDKIHLRNGSVLEGKVKVVKTDLVEFVEKQSNLLYEFKKSEIQVIVLSSGQTISFADQPAPAIPQPQPVQPTVVEKDHGAPVGLVILASVGAVLVILLLIGAAAS